MARYTIRPMVEADIPALVNFYNVNAKLEPVVESSSLSEFTAWRNNPANSTLYLPAFLQRENDSEGKLIAVLEYTFRPRDNMAWGWMQVHPDYRLQGVGRAVYGDFERRAIEDGAAGMTATPNQQATLLIEFLERRGFAFERYGWRMRLPTEQRIEQAILPEGISVRAFVPNQDEELFMQVRNAIFADHYGGGVRTLEEMTYRTRLAHFRPDDIVFAFDGNEIAGFCHTESRPMEHERLGIVQSLGVMPTYRGKGLGRALLLMSINYLRQTVSVIELSVEGKNAKALALYESVGFQRYKGRAHMRKALTQATASAPPVRAESP